MYAVTSIWFVRRTRATLRSAEFGFFGVVVYTRVHTPRVCGAATRFLRPLPDFRPGVASFFVFGLRPLRTSWDVVGIRGPMVAALTGWLSDMRGSPRRPERRTNPGTPTDPGPDGRRPAGSLADPRPRRSRG